MKLPQGDKAIVSREKLLGYVLSETHATGKFKAKFFRKLGFNETNINLLQKALKTIANSNGVKEGIKSEYGTKFVIDGEINTPIGKVVMVRTIWIIEAGQVKPRFITVYPV